MKKKLVLIIIPVALAAGFYFGRSEHQPSPTEVNAPRVSKNKKLFLGKRKKIKTQGPQAKLDTGCDDLSNELNDLDFNLTQEEWKERLDPKILKTCTSKKWQTLITKVIDSCFGKKVEEGLCQAQILFLRAGMRTEGVTDSTDREVLADLILKEFSQDPPNFKNLHKYVSELLSQDPDNLAFQKIWAMASLLSRDDLRNLPESFKDDIYERLNPELLNDPDLATYRLFLETGLNPVKAEDFARNYVSQFPERSDSYEVLGWSLWYQGRREEALSQLQKAIALSPKDQWLRQMYQDLQSPDAKLETYKGRMNLGVRFEDLFE